MPSLIAVDPAILHAAQVAAEDNVCSLQMKRTMRFLNYNIMSTKKYLFKLECHENYDFIPDNFSMIGKIVEGPNKKAPSIQPIIMSFHG